jgi:hypothetical protein
MHFRQAREEITKWRRRLVPGSLPLILEAMDLIDDLQERSGEDQPKRDREEGAEE